MGILYNKFKKIKAREQRIKKRSKVGEYKNTELKQGNIQGIKTDLKWGNRISRGIKKELNQENLIQN